MSRSDEVRAAQRAGGDGDTAPDMDKVLAGLKQALGLDESGLCPHCGQPMKQKQVKRCVVADPCGHRLYQGKAK